MVPSILYHRKIRQEEDGNTNMKKSEWLLVMVTICWGSSYLLMKLALDSVGEMTLIGLRFGIAFALTAVLFHRKLKGVSLHTTGYAALQGALLLGVFVSITYGLKTTSTSNAGFLVSLTVIFVPILSAVFMRQRMKPQLTAGISLAIAGIGLLTLKMPLSMQPGDILCIAAAFLYAVYVLVTSRAVRKKVDMFQLGILQLAFTGGYGFVLAFLLEKPSLPHSLNGWLSVGALAVVCSAFCYIAQPLAQRYTSPARAGLIFALEPVFAALFGYLFADEVLGMQGYIGALLVMSGVLVSEYGGRWISALRKKKSGQPAVPAET